MAGTGGQKFLGLPASAWNRLNPDGIVVVALFLGIPGLIWAGLSPLMAALVACILGILYFGWRCLEQWIGWQRDRTAQEREALKVLSELTSRIMGTSRGRSGKSSLTKSDKDS